MPEGTRSQQELHNPGCSYRGLAASCPISHREPQLPQHLLVRIFGRKHHAEGRGLISNCLQGSARPTHFTRSGLAACEHLHLLAGHGTLRLRGCRCCNSLPVWEPLASLYIFHFSFNLILFFPVTSLGFHVLGMATFVLREK